MSLEAALAENTAALKEVAELLRVSNAGREAAIGKITEAQGGDAPAAGRKGRPPKNADAAAEKPAEKPAPKKDPTIDDLREEAERFMQVAEDQKPARREFVKAVINHFGPNPDPEKKGFVFAVPPEHYGWAIDALKTKAGNITSPIDFPEKDEEPAGEEDEDLI